MLCANIIPVPFPVQWTWTQVIAIAKQMKWIDGTHKDARLTLSNIFPSSNDNQVTIIFQATCKNCKTGRTLPADTAGVLELRVPTGAATTLENIVQETVGDHERDVLCGNCGHGIHEVSLYLAYTTGKHIIAHLPRCQAIGKNRREIHIPLLWDQAGSKYRLICAIIHCGPEANSGHYFLLVAPGWGQNIRRNSGHDAPDFDKWLLLDDGNPPALAELPSGKNWSLKQDATMILFKECRRTTETRHNIGGEEGDGRSEDGGQLALTDSDKAGGQFEQHNNEQLLETTKRLLQADNYHPPKAQIQVLLKDGDFAKKLRKANDENHFLKILLRAAKNLDLGWKQRTEPEPQETGKKTDKKPPNATNKDKKVENHTPEITTDEWGTLVPDNIFTVPAKTNAQILESGEGIAFGTYADYLLLRNGGAQSLGILTKPDKKRPLQGTELTIQAYNLQGKACFCQVELLQCGVVPVGIRAQEGFELGADQAVRATVLRIEVDKEWTPRSHWDHFAIGNEKGTAFTSTRLFEWIRTNLSTEVYDLSLARLNKEGNMITATFRVPERLQENILRLSGLQNIWVQPTDRDYGYKHVWIPGDAHIYKDAQHLEQRVRAARIALQKIPHHVGLVREQKQKTIGIRCKPADAHSIHNLVRPDTTYREGEKYHIFGLPREIDPETIIQTLKQQWHWQAQVIRRGTAAKPCEILAMTPPKLTSSPLNYTLE